MPLLAVVTAGAPDVGLAAALASDHAQLWVSVTVTHPPVRRAHWVTVTRWRREKEGGWEKEGGMDGGRKG